MKGGREEEGGKGRGLAIKTRKSNTSNQASGTITEYYLEKDHPGRAWGVEKWEGNAIFSRGSERRLVRGRHEKKGEEDRISSTIKR